MKQIAQALEDAHQGQAEEVGNGAKKSLTASGAAGASAAAECRVFNHALFVEVQDEKPSWQVFNLLHFLWVVS
jgi:hypothetical protein